MRVLASNFVVCLMLMTGPAAASAGPAADLIRDLADRAIETLAETKGDLAAREARLRPILASGFDMEHIAKFTLGRYWNRATEEQRQSYVAAFADFVIATYARRFGGYSGETLEIVAEREMGPKDIAVATRIVRGSTPPIEAEWRVRVDEGAPKVIDVVVEGVSMSVTQRADFSSVVRRNGIDGLIQVLQARAGRLGAQ